MTTVSALARVGCLLSFVALTACGSDTSSGVEEWPVEGKVVGASKHGDDPKKSKDLSGIACDREDGFPRNCLVIDDEAQAAQAVTVYDGRITAGSVVPLISNSFDGKPLELDGEAVAFADGAFYVLGSHGHPRDRKQKLDERDDADEIQAKITASSQVLRVTLPQSAFGNEGEVEAKSLTSTARLREALQAIPAVSAFIDRRLDQSGLTLEGAAVARGRLYAGLRSPVLDGAAVVVHADLAALFGQGALATKMDRLDLGGRGVRDLVAYKGAFLVLAGPAPDQDGEFAVYSWDGSGGAKLIGALADYGEDEKPEAILPLDEAGGTLRLLVLFDGAKEGAPRAITFRR